MLNLNIFCISSDMCVLRLHSVYVVYVIQKSRKYRQIAWCIGKCRSRKLARAAGTGGVCM